MSFLERLFNPPSLSYGGGEDRMWGLLEPPTASGMPVSPETAMRTSAVMACVRVLSETLASLPLILYRRRADGGKERATKEGLYSVLHDTPNSWQTSFEWREMLMAHLALRGNAYCYRVPGSKGASTELIPWHPDRVRVERLENGSLRYQVRQDNGQELPYMQNEVFHVRGLSLDGIVGVSLIRYAKEAIGMSMAAEVHGAALFKNGARPGVVLEHPGALKADAARTMREDWERIHGGAYNTGKTAVLFGGMKAHELGMNNQDAQYLEQRRFQVEEIARIFRVPLHLIGDLSRSTNNNIEQQSLEFIIYTMMPWLKRWEGAIQRDLIADDDKFFAEFLVNGLLRGDTAARSAFYMAMLDRGVFCINDVLGFENMNPIGPDGDKRLVPLNMTTLEKAGEEPPQPKALPAPEPKPKEDDDEEDESIAVKAFDAISLQQQRFTETITAIQEQHRDELRETTEQLQQVSEEKGAIAQEAQSAAERAEAARMKLQEVEPLKETVSGFQAAAADALQREFGRMTRIEANAVLKAAKNPDTFLASIDSLYVQHYERITTSLAAVSQLYVLATGKQLDMPTLAEQHIIESKQALLDLAGEHTAETLLAGVEECVSSWGSRSLGLEI